MEILGTSPMGMEDAIAMIKMIAFDPEIGQEFDVTVTVYADFGAIVDSARTADAMPPYFGTRLETRGNAED